jgi:hypothetical protein
VDQHPHRKARPDPDCRLDVEIALDDALPGTVGIALRGLAKRADQVGLAVPERQLRADAEQG